ncbi:MAG TPA: sigma-E factor regulatory protein RseB domain-containing protein [Candidatus Baltobacteraceae bacterium]|nr:sigma-E factor regulatory protein RseB domain-containing protein [Candidatus Baltobacteraceae bacterium]
MVKPLAVAFAALFFLLPALACADEATSVLHAAILAPRYLSYIGQIESVRFSETGSNATIERIEHRAPGLTRRSFLAPKNLFGDYHLTSGDTTYAVDVKHASVTITHEPAVGEDPIPDATLALVLANYHAILGQNQVIAGRPTRSVTLLNRYSGERTLRIWIDQHTHLILKREAYDPDGSIVSLMLFEALRYTDEIPLELFTMEIPEGFHSVDGINVTAPTVDIRHVEEQCGFSSESPSYLPQGFRLVGASLDGNTALHTLHLFYSDGLRDLSLFETSGSAPDFAQLPSRPAQVSGRPATYAEEGSTALLSWRAGKLHHILVGNLTQNELTEIAQSVGSKKDAP